MEWLKAKKENFKNIELVNNENSTYCVNLSPKDYYSKDEDFDMLYLSAIINHNPSTFDIKQALISLQKEYDKSDEINSFTINGITGWFDNATRLALVNACNLLIESSIDEYELFIGNTSIIISPEVLKDFLKDVEFYAMNCYKTTAEHLNEINSLTSREEILNYDISDNYPEKINYIIDE